MTFTRLVLQQSWTILEPKFRNEATARLKVPREPRAPEEESTGGARRDSVSAL